MTNREKLIEMMLGHKDFVARMMAKFSAELAYRAAIHDESKFRPAEFDVFEKLVPHFGKFEYGTPEWEEVNQQLREATAIHHAKNRHHPEHFENGIDDMNLIDLVEMLADWKAASTRSPKDHIRKSMPKLQERYGISPQLLKILENTLKDFKMYD